MAFKTGTSFGFKDAVTAAITPAYTVAVWFGNVSGKYSPALAGREAAAPAAIEIMNELTRFHSGWFTLPDSVSRREICETSGKLPGEHCPAQAIIRDCYLPGISSAEICDVHKQILISTDDKNSFCPSCAHLSSKPKKKIIVVSQDVNTAWFLRSQGRKRDEIPPHFPGCPKKDLYLKPVIAEPENGSAFVIFKLLPAEGQKIPLRVFAALDVDSITWYVNGKLLFQKKPLDVSFLEPAPGKMEITAIDNNGRSAVSTITVEEK
ncbi:MAG: hypothetical protein A2096_13860 [Spirochaetes bacterium GWF1_41_5]|nr:MAG: hypothetical protein A2096_13860 [Spirochaetes bacterium GWF1_41_5]